MSDRIGDEPAAASGSDDPGQVLKATMDALAKLRLDQSPHVQGSGSETGNLGSTTDGLSSLTTRLATPVHDPSTTTEQIGETNAGGTSAATQLAMMAAKPSMTQAENAQFKMVWDAVLEEMKQSLEKVYANNLHIVNSRNPRVTPELRRRAHDQMDGVKKVQELLDITAESICKWMEDRACG